MALLLLLATGCGGQRAPDSAPASGAATDTAVSAAPTDTGTAVATRPDSAAPARSADTAARPARTDTAAAPQQQARTTRPQDTAKTVKPEPAVNVRPKPTPAPKPAPTPKPAPAPAETGSTAEAADTQATDTQATAAAGSTATSQDTAQAPAPQADAPLRDAYHQAPRDTVSQTVYDGWKQYNLNCARCHGEDALGTTIAPHLILSLKPDGPINTPELFTQVVCAGRPAKGMPSWCALGLEMDKIQSIYSYVKGRSAGQISPGRPAVKQEG